MVKKKMKDKWSKSVLLSLALIIFLTSLVFAAAQTMRGSADVARDTIMNCLIEERCQQIDIVWQQITQKLGLEDKSGQPYFGKVWNPATDRWIEMDDAYAGVVEED